MCFTLCVTARPSGIGSGGCKDGWIRGSRREGRAHASAPRPLLARETVGQMIVSPLGRTRETAELILKVATFR